jgi:hypothetical protein
MSLNPNLPAEAMLGRLAQRLELTLLMLELADPKARDYHEFQTSLEWLAAARQRIPCLHSPAK